MLRFDENGAWLMTFVVAAAVVGACGGINDEPLSGRPSSGGVINGANDEGLNVSGQGAGTGAATGLPCDVQQLLENRCIGCHLGPSPAALLTFDDLNKPGKSSPKKLAELALQRMQDTANPMPPAPAVAPTPAEIATLDGWVKAGMPKGAACTAPGTTTLTGNPYGTPLVCTSNKTWTSREESSSMDPGHACITCHTMRGGPPFSIAGTVYPTAHEPNDCYGVPGGNVNVVVTDAAGQVTTLRVNGAGNFQFEGRVTPPFKVKVTNGAGERAMAGSLTAGDCNTCHTQDGANGAPGRIMAP